MEIMWVGKFDITHQIRITVILIKQKFEFHIIQLKIIALIKDLLVSIN